MRPHNKTLVIAMSIATIIGGTAAWLTWYESRKSRKLQEEVLTLDKQIKQLDLMKRSGRELI